MGTKLAIVFLIGGGQPRKIQQERGNQAVGISGDSCRKNLAHKRHNFPAISWLQNLNVSFPQRRFPFFPRTFPATRARGSHDLRPRVTRPAPAGHATCARGSLAMRRSETEISLGKPASPRGRIYHWLAIAVKPSKHLFVPSSAIPDCVPKIQKGKTNFCLSRNWTFPAMV